MTQQFSYSSELDASQEDVFEYHCRPGAIDRLIPPWESMEVMYRAPSLEPGSQVVLQQSLFGIRQHWVAEHTDFSPPEEFRDEQRSGPFHSWRHAHRVESLAGGRSRLVDEVAFELPLQPWSGIARNWINKKLHQSFRYRHETTSNDLQFREFLSRWTSKKPLRIAVSGASGLIGTRVCALASVLGHEVLRITRPESSSKNESARIGTGVQFCSERGFDRPELINGADAVIHLAGFGIADRRWTSEIKNRILVSRRDGTRSLLHALNGLASPPKALVSASGIGVYGNAGSGWCDENAPAANDFLGRVAQEWESAAMEYQTGDRRVAIGRLAMVLHPREGALSKMLPLFRMGFGGRLGSGKQYWSWIHVDDAASAFLFLAACPEAAGPFNFCAPEPLTNQDFTRELATALRRPAFLPAPAFALRMALGEMADALLLSSARAKPARLAQFDFPFRATHFSEALQQLLGHGPVDAAARRT